MMTKRAIGNEAPPTAMEPVREGAVNGARRQRTPDPQRQIRQDVDEAEGEKRLLVQLPGQVAQEAPFHHETHCSGGQAADEDRKPEAETVLDRDGPAHVGANHVQGAVGEVQNSHHPEDQ